MYNVKHKKKEKKSDIPTPDLLCKFLYDILSPHYNPKVILDPCAGDGRLTKYFNCEKINYEIKDGKDIFDINIPLRSINCDMVIMNPPFNSGNGKTLISELFFNRVYDLIKDRNIPIIMICPFGFRLNQKKKSCRWKSLRDWFPNITTIISLPLDYFKDVLFHTEILCFNTDKLKPHYFLDDDYLAEP
jgi:type I restriction-modification system DNA methylase subunit